MASPSSRIPHTKGARGRDYAAEYAHRKSLGAARGLSLAQIRGHAPPGERISDLRRQGLLAPPGDTSNDSALTRFYQAVQGLAQGKSLRQAAHDAHISPATVTRLNAERQLFSPIPRFTQVGRWSGVAGYWVRTAGTTPILTHEGALITSPQVDAKTASLLGTYWNAVDAALKGDDRDLRRFAGATIFTIDGESYRLLTNANAIRRWFDQLSDADERDFWRSFYTRGEVLSGSAA